MGWEWAERGRKGSQLTQLRKPWKPTKGQEVWGLVWDLLGKQGCLSPFLGFSFHISHGICIALEEEGPGQNS